MKSYLYLIYGWARGEIWAIPGRVIAVGFFVFLFLFPILTQQPFYLRIVTFACIYSIFAASWDFLSGFTGQLNAGQALFFGSASYIVALLNIHLNLSPWVTIPVGAIGAVAVGLIVGIPALRLRGFYLALATLSFPLILTGVIFIFPGFTGGEIGLSGITPLSNSAVKSCYIAIIIFIISALMMWKLCDPRSKIFRTGVILHAIREDEIAARTSGIDTTKYKLLAFAISGFFAGISGGLYTHFLRVSGPSGLELLLSFQAILWTIFGGIATIYGSVTGVFILYSLVEILCLHPLGVQVRFIFFAVILIVTALFMPEGITVWLLDKIEVKCPRCKLINIFTRKNCRACCAPLHLERK